jgi:hypothetical protein
MRDAMGRVVTVNASRGSTGSAGEFGIGSIAEPEHYGGDFAISTAPVGILAKGTDQGPCLYLGPRGQRCSRRATTAGFCAMHQPHGITASGISRPSKKLMASVLAIAAVVWPYLADIVREVIRWIHAH